MKILTYLAISVFAVSCTLYGQHDPQEAAVVKNVFNTKPPQEIDRQKANDMHRFYAKTRVKKSAPFYVTFNREELIQILQASDQETVKVLVGAYMDDEASSKKLYPTILVQTGHTAAPSSKAAAAALTYKYYEGSTLCPPPTDCAPLEQ